MAVTRRHVNYQDPEEAAAKTFKTDVSSCLAETAKIFTGMQPGLIPIWALIRCSPERDEQDALFAVLTVLASPSAM